VHGSVPADSASAGICVAKLSKMLGCLQKTDRPYDINLREIFGKLQPGAFAKVSNFL
jgi:hypothetical protein